MAGRVAAYLVACRDFMGVSMAIAFCLAVLYLVALKWFRWNSGSLRVFGLMFALGRRGLFAISMWYLRMVYLLVFLAERQSVTRFSVVMLLVTGLLSGGLSAGILGAFREACNSALILAGLMVGNLLVNYMKEIQFDWSIAAVYGLLSLFILLYGLYFMMRDISRISKGRKETDVEQDFEEKTE